MRTNVATLLCSVFLVSATAGAQTASSSAAPAHAPTAARLAINRGAVAYLAHNYDQAMTAFREAQSGTGEDRIEAALDVAQTLVAQGNTDAAVAAYREALQAAMTATDDMNHGRALQGIAVAYETVHRFDDAQTAWQEYLTFAQSHTAVASATNAQQRLDAFRARTELDQRYAIVRQRIEERRRLNASGQTTGGGTQGGGGH